MPKTSAKEAIALYRSRIGSMDEGDVEILRALLRFTDGCRDSMHEPDEQDVFAKVVGDHLDNAFGNTVRGKFADGSPCSQEFVVRLRRGNRRLDVNLADLIALARRAEVK